MALEQRFYSSDSGTGIDAATGEVVFERLIVLHPIASRGFTMRGDDTYLILATEDEWAAFDAENPNQDAQTGSPFRRRYPRTDLPYLNVTE